MSKEKRESTHPEADFNPYHPFELKSGEWFYNGYNATIKLIKKIFDDHPDNRAILLYGNPGTGKTSILKQIANSKPLLGENYIPIYLNLRELVNFKGDKLLSYVGKYIIDTLAKNEYANAMDSHIEVISHIKDLALDSVLLKIDSSLESNVLLLLLDNFDILLENLGAKTISAYIKYLELFERSWRHYGIILAGSKYKIRSTQYIIIEEFLDTAYKINLDDFLDEDAVTKLIVEPAKNHLAYDKEAIHKITWYSGKNLYYQQLICYFIVLYYFYQEEKDRCSAEDVDNAIERILVDRNKEFSTVWNKNLSLEFKLIVSALADESITKKESNFYILRHNKILGAVFGERIFEIIEKLQYLGYINRIYESHFTEFPFKIPLYGYWIQKEHPFIKTVVDNIEALADKINLNMLIEEINKTLVDKLKLFDKEAIWQTAEKWHSLKSSIIQKRKAPAKDTLEGFLESFANLLKIGSKPKWQTVENYFKLNIKSLNIGILEEASCFIQGGPEITEGDIINIESRAAESAEKTNTQLTLFFCFKKSDSVEELVKKTYLNLIALDEKDLLIILFSKKPAETLRKTTLNRLSLQSISPYQTEGPARATFYGRSDVIKRIIGSPTSFSIVGARKIGKSSLLHKIKDNPPKNSEYIFLNLELEFHDVKDVRNYTKFLKSLEEEIRLKFKKKVAFRKFPLGWDIDKLPKVIKSLPRKGKKIIFVFDEIDGLLQFDKAQGYKLMHIFRAMSEKNYCQFIFAGFMELYHTKHDYENPMYNFCQEEILHPLEKAAALDLITKPMEKIGVRYKNPEVRDPILEYTARHPNLIQFFCKKLVEKVDKHPRIEDRRTIFETDISEVFDTEYQDYIMNDVYMFFSKLSDINRLILILLIEEPEKKYFSLDEIHTLLSDCGIRMTLNDVHRNLKELVVRFILIEEETKYRFAIPVFPFILRKRTDNYFKDKTINEIKKEIKANA
ncbi:MAG: AAA family ATPase [Candidatus Aminicenantes bacterium]|nr:AAA family ATPase [Candidatus Aminicenantes bacterium]